MNCYRSNNEGTSMLWHALEQKYPFNNPQDWYKFEAHWLDRIESFKEQPVDCPGKDADLNNSITRISQCNESYQLCNSLPRSFIVPKDLKDFTLINSMSTVIKDHRVPVISYCCPIEYKRTFILRCASFDMQTQVIDTLKKVVKPLTVLNLSIEAPSLESIESAHKKLRDVCKPGNEQVTNFISKSGKWLKIVSKTLTLVKQTARTLLTESSVILIENNDKGWNSLVSSLVQIVLEPHRRTFVGLESLISKEWIYLSGGKPDYTKPDIIFILFLDCIYQIYIQNQSKFEFTSEYLRSLFDAQYIDTSLYSYNNSLTNSIKRGTNNYLSKLRRSAFYTIDSDKDSFEGGRHDRTLAYYKPSSIDVAELSTLNNSHTNNNDSDKSIDYTNSSIYTKINKYNSETKSNSNGSPSYSKSNCENGTKVYDANMHNPFYDPERSDPLIEVYDHMVNIKIWSSLYLRWQSKIKYDCIEEVLFFQLRGNETSAMVNQLPENRV